MQMINLLIPTSFSPYCEMVNECQVCASLVLQVICWGLLVCSCFTWPFSERSSEAKPLPRARSCKWRYSVGWQYSHSAPAFVAHALQGSSPTQTAQHLRLWKKNHTNDIWCLVAIVDYSFFLLTFSFTAWSYKKGHQNSADGTWFKNH